MCKFNGPILMLLLLLLLLFFLLEFLLSMTCSGRTNEEIVRPRVPLEACLATFSAPEELPDFYSTALKAKTTATK